MSSESPSIRSEYQRCGADQFYRESGSAYRNPHEPQIEAAIDEAIRRWSLDLTHVLDLAAGSGEITLALRERGATQISAIDPFTFDAYSARTGSPAERFTFEQIAEGAISSQCYSLIVCSFAMHLCEPSRLPALTMQLSLIAPSLLILTPHKRPIIRSGWGWNIPQEFVVQRIRARLYNSTNTHGSPNQQPDRSPRI